MDTLYERLSKAVGASVDGFLSNGRYYLRVQQYRAIMQPPKIQWVGEETVPLPEAPYREVLLDVSLEVDFYMMRDEFEQVVKFIKGMLDEDFERRIRHV